MENCTIERCGQTFFGAVGVWVGMSVDTTLRNNEIRNLPYTGVSVGWCWDARPTICRGHQIRDNNIHHVMQTLSDGGGIYTLGRQPGTVLAGNVIHDIQINSGRAKATAFLWMRARPTFKSRTTPFTASLAPDPLQRGG